MTINLRLAPEEEARLIAVAGETGLSADALLRQALDHILAEAGPVAEFPAAVTGGELVAAMQACPHKHLDLDPVRDRPPVRDVPL
jgi:hypothetical protein